MALPTPGDRAAETSTTTGTGTYSLGGAITGWQGVVAACGDGATVDYFVRDQAGGADFEVGRGVVTDAATDTLTRATILSSSNAGAAVNWGAGTRDIVICLTADAMSQLLADEHIGVTVQGFDADTAKYDAVTANFTGTLQNGASNVLVDTDISSTVQPYNATTVLDADVTYELLNTNGDVGTGAGQLAIGNHLHTGVYEPADATIVKDADIGVTVQGYDVDTAKLDVVQSFTAQQTFKEYAETQYSLTGTVIDPANGSLQYKTLGANTTFTESLANGQSVTLMINDGTARTATWPTTTWVGGAAPTLPTTGYAVIELWQINSVLYGLHSGDA